MKKIFITAVLLAGMAFSVLACGGETVKLPVSTREKVSFAFNGVERSFSGSSKTADATGLFTAYADENAFDSALQTIKSLYGEGDDQGDIIEDLEYDQPPMIQFQCLKAVFDKVGEGYSFGVKYYDEITGEVYFDMATGAKKKATDEDAEEYKYGYTFGLAIDIAIDDDDFITADVSFSITLTKGDEEYDAEWYVRLELDYDMKKSEPNYTLAMWTANDETEIEHRGQYTYEYDYVEVKDNKIQEWRKFVIEPDTELIKDESHQSFDAYENAGIDYTVGNCKWYYGSSLKKITQMTAAKKSTAAGALFSMGLNSTDTDGKPFADKIGTRNGTIKTVYNDFSGILKMDFVNALVCDDEDGEAEGGEGEGRGNENRTAAGITIKRIEPESEWIEQSIIRDATLREIMTRNEFWNSNDRNRTPRIWYVDENGGTISRVEEQELSDFTYKITLGDVTKDVTLETRLSDVIAEEFGSDALENSGFKISITVTEKAHVNFVASFGAYVDFYSDIRDKEGKIFPASLTAIGVPEYDTEGSYDLETGKEGGYELSVINSTAAEFEVYKRKLDGEGFIKDEIGKYVRITENNKVLKIGLNFSVPTLKMYVDVIDNETYAYTTEWQTDTVCGYFLENKFDRFPAPDGVKKLFYTSYANKYVYVYGLTSQEIEAYISGLEELDNVLFVGNGDVRFIDGENIYTVRYNKETDCLYLGFDINANNVTKAFMIAVKGREPQAFGYIDEMPDHVRITVKLTAGDEFYFLPKEGYGLIVCHESDYFDVNYETGVHTVRENGTYTFTYSESDMRAEKA